MPDGQREEAVLVGLDVDLGTGLLVDRFGAGAPLSTLSIMASYSVCGLEADLCG